MTALRPYSTTAHGGLTSTVRTFTPHARRPLTSPEGVPDQVAELAGFPIATTATVRPSPAAGAPASTPPLVPGPTTTPPRERFLHTAITILRSGGPAWSTGPPLRSRAQLPAPGTALTGGACAPEEPRHRERHRHQDGNEHGGTGLGQRALGRTGLRARRDGGDRLLGRRRAHGRLQRGRLRRPQRGGCPCVGAATGTFSMVPVTAPQTYSKA